MFNLQLPQTLVLILVCSTICLVVADKPTSTIVHQIIEHQDYDPSPFFSPDSSKLLMVEGGNALLYHLKDGRYVQVEEFPLGFIIQDVAWSPDSRQFALRYFSSLVIYELQGSNYKDVQEFSQEDIVTHQRMGLQFCQNTKYLISPENQKLVIYKFDQKKLKYEQFKTIKCQDKQTRISITQDCSRILLSNLKQTKVIGFNEGQISDQFHLGSNQSKNALAINYDGQQVLIQSNGELQIWNRTQNTKYSLKTTLTPKFRGKAHMSKNFRTLVIATNDSCILFRIRNNSYQQIQIYQLKNVKEDTIPIIDITSDGLKLAISYQIADSYSRTLIYELQNTSEYAEQEQQHSSLFSIVVLGTVLVVAAILAAQYLTLRKKQHRYTIPHVEDHDLDK